MKTFILLFGLLLSFASFAQGFVRENSFLFPSGTLDGHVRISSENPLSPGVKWVRVFVNGNGKKEDNYYAVREGEVFDKNLSLRYGPGNYNFMIMTSKSDAKYGSYVIMHSGVFVNSESEVLDAIDPSCEVQSDNEEIIELAEAITRGLQTDMQKTKAIHDWVATNIAYDADSYFDGSYVNKSWDAVSVLHSKKAICFGYSNITAALNRAVGIQAKVIVSDAKPGSTWTAHAWNRVLIDGKWIPQDTTWDAGRVNMENKFYFAYRDLYFNTPEEVFARNHREPAQ
jgi:hypothetical protein